LKQQTDLDSYQLVGAEKVHVSDFSSVEGEEILVFLDLEDTVPLSGSQWTDVQVDQLKVRFEGAIFTKLCFPREKFGQQSRWFREGLTEPNEIK
jgi:hypothetical protein